ncbi:hypothetical protein B0H63DRAFT_449748 [Podospora didyma]|uniref:BTB domain-containing protein n=1 Tax=Podospora didyma TaxID=330526 RepID=A0AAE0U046_9PEZI|nr:hypothetical protein B0H63DRAFT_449748 [Podospora didyma]
MAPSVYESLGGFYQNEMFSDLTVICGEKTFKMHRAIVCSQSTALFQSWADNPEPEPLDDYVTEFSHAMFTSLRMYMAAGRSGMPTLKLLARECFNRSIERHVLSSDFRTVVDVVYSLTELSGLFLKESCIRLIAANYNDLDFMKSMQPVMRKHGDLATGVLNYFMLHYSMVSVDEHAHGSAWVALEQKLQSQNDS